MATVEQLTIQFEGKGAPKLTGQLNALSAAMNRLAGKQIEATRATKGASKATDSYNDRLTKNGRNVTALTGAFGRFGKRMSQMRSQLLIVAFAIGTVAKVFSSLHKAVSEFQVAQGKLNGVLKSTGFTAGKTKTQLENMANTLQSSLGVANTAIMEMQGRLLTFTNIVGKQFDETIKIATDMSNVLGTDLNGTIIQVGKALQDPILGLTALRRVGVNFTEQQKDQIKALIANGDIIKAQQVILSELKTEFGGATEAINENAKSTKALKDLQNEWGDATREIGLATDGLTFTLIQLGRVVTSITQKTFGVVNGFTDWAATFLQTGAIFQQGIKDEMKFIEVTGAASTSIRKFQTIFKGYGEEVQKAAEQNKKFTSIDELNKYLAQIDDATKTDKERLEILEKLSEAIVKNNFVLRAQSDLIDTEKLAAEKEAIRVKEQLEKDFTNLIVDQTQVRISQYKEEANAKISIINEQKRIELDALRATFRFQRASDKKKAELEKEIIDRHKKQEDDLRKETNKKLKQQFRIKQAIDVSETIMSTQKAVMATLGQTGWFGMPLAKLVKIQGALSVASILAQEPPKMEKGGLVGGRRHSQGGTMIEAEQGEYVVSRAGVQSIGIEALNRINAGGGSAVNITFSGNVMSKDFIEDEAIPQIKEAIRRGADIGVG